MGLKSRTLFVVVNYTTPYIQLYKVVSKLLMIASSMYKKIFQLCCNDYRMTDAVGEILKGLRCYFDRALPVILLYNNERKQYQDFVTDNVSPSTIYGAEHLLRLCGMLFLE